MKTIELDRIVDTGKAFQDQARTVFGTADNVRILKANGYDSFVTGLSGVQTNDRMPNARIIPIGENLSSLVGAKNKVFAVQAGNGLHPAVVTERTSSHGVHVTYLADVRDKLNPGNPRLSTLQKGLLQKIRALQNPTVGTHTADGQSVGVEFGHQQLGVAAVLKPDLLVGTHAVHHWAESIQGVAGAVTDPNNVTIYDVRLDDGTTRQVREVSAVLTNGVLIDHPEFHTVDELEINASPRDFAVGLGIIAVESQIGLGNVTNRVMDNLQRL